MGKENKRQQIWSEIRKQKTAFTIESLTGEIPVEKETIKTFVSGLCKAGFIKVIEQQNINVPHVKTSFKRNCYALSKDVGFIAPRVTRDGKILPDEINQDLWRSMKILKEFSVADLMTTTPRPTTLYNVETYCRMLCRAKYLKRNGSRFVFIKSTGAKAPQILRIKAVFDPNLKQIVYQSGGEE